MRHRLTLKDQRLGGKVVSGLPGGDCPRCSRTFERHSQLAGHLGLHTYADRYCGGDMQAALRSINLVGLAHSDPMPRNGAFARAHAEARRIAALKEKFN